MRIEQVATTLLLLFACSRLSSEGEKPNGAPAAEAIDRLVQQLGDPSLEKRQEAFGKLKAVGLPAEERLKAALESEDPEIRAVAARLLEALHHGPEVVLGDFFKGIRDEDGDLLRSTLGPDMAAGIEKECLDPGQGIRDWKDITRLYKTELARSGKDPADPRFEEIGADASEMKKHGGDQRRFKVLLKTVGSPEKRLKFADITLKRIGLFWKIVKI